MRARRFEGGAFARVPDMPAGVGTGEGINSELPLAPPLAGKPASLFVSDLCPAAGAQ